MHRLRNLLILAAAMTLAANALAHDRGSLSDRSYFDQSHRSGFSRQPPQYRHAPGHHRHYNRYSNQHHDKQKYAHRKHRPSHNDHRDREHSRLSLYSLGNGLSVQIYQPSSSRSSYRHYHYHGNNRRCYSRH